MHCLESTRQAAGLGAAMLLALLLAGGAAVPAAAQDDGAPSPTRAPLPTPTPHPGPVDTYGRGSPRGALQGFITAARDGDWERAAQYLARRGGRRPENAAAAMERARELKAVLDHHLWIDWTTVSADATGDREDGLPRALERLGVIERADGEPVEVLLERVPRADDGAPIWQFAPGTLAAVPELYDALGYGPLAAVLPSFAFDVRVLDVQLWQWLGLLAAALLALALSWIATAVLLRLGRPWLAARERVRDSLARLVAGPVRLLCGVLLFRAMAVALVLPVPARAVLATAAAILLVLAVVWLGMRLTDVAVGVLDERFRSRRLPGVAAVLPLARKTAKVLLLLLGLLAVLQHVGFNVTSVLAGLGIGGLAVALAAQKTLENFFGGLSLIMDQPVRVGDFCRFGDRIGTVEDIGIRSTRVRTLDRTVVTIPNAEFSSLQLENFAPRDRIWLHPVLPLRYDTTSDQLRYLLVEIKALLLAHPKIDPDPARVRFVGFGAHSLDLEIFAYVRTANIDEFLAVREDVFLRIMTIVEASGTSFAVPSRTLFLGRDRGRDDERRAAAEAEVAEWRRAKRLYLPDFPPEAAGGLERLAWPPEGAPRRR